MIDKNKININNLTKNIANTNPSNNQKTEGNIKKDDNINSSNKLNSVSENSVKTTNQIEPINSKLTEKNTENNDKNKQ